MMNVSIGQYFKRDAPTMLHLFPSFSALSEPTGGKTDGVVESLTDTDSVKGLGETTDLLNMVRVSPLEFCVVS